MNRLWAGFLLASFLIAASVWGQEPSDNFGPKPARSAEAKAQYEASLAASKGKPDLLVLPGLKADRKARTVEVLVETTGLRADEVAEFLLVGHESSRGYEALLWSYAKPGDVHSALKFIGLKPGRPRNPVVPSLSLGGDRVTLTMRDEEGNSVPIERLILDKQTEKTLPEEGFIFSGSLMIPPTGTNKAARFVADVDELRSVASIYNEPTAILDVPRRASQGEVYGNQVVNPEFALKGGLLRTVVMTPGPSDGKATARNLRLSITEMKGTNGIVCRLTEKEKTLCDGAPITSVVERLAALRKEGEIPVIDLSLGEALQLNDICKAAVLIAMMEALEMIAVEPPSSGQLYYRAFVPDKAWLEPEGRPCQPWELHLSRRDGKVAGQMVWQESLWSADGATETFKRTEHPVADAQALRARLTADAQERITAGKSALPAVLLVYAQPGLTYGELMAFIRPSLDTHGTVYVFLEHRTSNAQR
jgi:hypothetical protein